MRDRVVEVVKKDVGGDWNEGPEWTWIVVVTFAVHLVFGRDSERLVKDTDTPAIFY
jgi:hypothetical protein